MQELAALLLVLAVFFAAIKAFGMNSGRVDFGWLSLALLFAGAFLLPALDAMPT